MCFNYRHGKGKLKTEKCPEKINFSLRNLLVPFLSLPVSTPRSLNKSHMDQGGKESIFRFLSQYSYN